MGRSRQTTWTTMGIIRRGLIGILVVAQGLAFLWIFLNIWTYGSMVLFEPNIPILILETATALGIVALGIFTLVVDALAIWNGIKINGK